MRGCRGAPPSAPRRSSISPPSGTTSACCAAAAPGAALMAVVKADGYGHGAVPVARAALAAGATWLGVCTSTRRSALRAAGITAPVLSWLHLPDEDFAAASPPTSTSRSRRAPTSPRVLAGRPAGRAARPAAPQDRHRAVPQRRAARRLAGAARRRRQGRRPTARRRSSRSGRTSPTPTSRSHPTSTARPPASTPPGRPPATAASTPMRHLANSAATLTRPDLHFDLVRPGIAVYGLDPLGRPVPREPAAPGDDAARARRAGQAGARGRGRVLRARLDDAAGDHARARPARVRRRRAARARPPRPDARAAGRRLRPVVGRVCMDQFIVDCGDDAGRARATRWSCSARATAASPPPRTGPTSSARSTTRSSPGVHGARVTRTLRRGRAVNRAARAVWGVLAGALGAAATGVVVGVAARQHAKIAADRRRLATQLSDTTETPDGRAVLGASRTTACRLSCEEIEADGRARAHRRPRARLRPRPPHLALPAPLPRRSSATRGCAWCSTTSAATAAPSARRARAAPSSSSATTWTPSSARSPPRARSCSSATRWAA